MILIESTRNLINTEEITRGTLIWSKHFSWEEGRTGIVSAVTEKLITVLFLPSLQNVRNHFTIPATELEDGDWMVRYSTDGLQTVISFGEEDEEG